MLYGRASSCYPERARLEQARRGAGHKDGAHAAVGAHNLNVAEIDIPAPSFRSAMGMEADLAEGLPGVRREIHSSEMGDAGNGIGMDRLVVLIHGQAIIRASNAFAAGETYLNPSNATGVLPLVEIQDVATANGVTVEGADLDRKVCDLPATG